MRKKTPFLLICILIVCSISGCGETEIQRTKKAMENEPSVLYSELGDLGIT